MGKRVNNGTALVKSVCEYLAAENIWHRRMQTGALVAGERFVRFGSRGMADILATPYKKIYAAPPSSDGFVHNGELKIHEILWLECKYGSGRQSLDQKSFQREVEFEGHTYLIVRSIDDVILWLKEHGYKRP